MLLVSGCGYDKNGLSDFGSYTCTIKWPRDIPTSERSSSAIDCNAAGVVTVAFTFDDGSGTYLTGDEWSCSLHQGTVHEIPVGTNRRLVVTGEDGSGKVLYRGEETGIEIVADQTNQGGEIEMVFVVNLPDTGQTQSFTDTFGEDSDYTINPPSYTDNGDGTVTDNNTGLIWQQEDDDTTRIWDDAASYCESLTLAVHSDWRLASKKELMSIVNYGTYGPSIDTTYFSNPNASAPYWSSITYAYDSSQAWFFHFSSGGVSHSHKTNSYYVRCVRGVEFITGDFTDNGDGTVTDNNTGLTWLQAEGGSMNWEEAITHCEGLSLAGYTDWRFPNIRELESITDYSLYGPPIDTTYFPGINASYYWSSTTVAFVSSEAWYVYLFDGGVYSSSKSDSRDVRCVRGGQ